MMVSLGSLAQRGLGCGRVMIDVRRTVALPDIMVASTVGLQGQCVDPYPKYGFAENNDDF
jgi:hypothetical protein